MMQGSSGGTARMSLSPGLLATLLICFLVIVVGGFLTLGFYYLRFTSNFVSEMLIRAEVGNDMLRLTLGDSIPDGRLSQLKGSLSDVGNAAREMIREIAEVRSDLARKHDELADYNVYLYKTLEDENTFRRSIEVEKAYCELLAKVSERTVAILELHFTRLMKLAKGDPKAVQLVRDINNGFSYFFRDGFTMSKHAKEMLFVNIELAEFLLKNRKWTKPDEGYIGLIDTTPSTIRSKYNELKSRSDSAIESYSNLRDRAWEHLETKAQKMGASLESEEVD